MAEVVRYVDTDASGTGTGVDWTNAYTSLSAWESAEQTDLVTDGDWHHVYVRASSGSADTTGVYINGWTTGASNYILIEAASGDEALASGWSTSRYRLSTTGSTSALSIEQNHVTVKGLQISYGTDGIGFQTWNITGTVKCQNCRINGTTTDGLGVYVQGTTSGTVTIENTIITGGDHGITQRDATGTVNAYNCIIYDVEQYGFWSRTTSVTFNITNCAVFTTGDDFLDSGTTFTINYCASDDGDGTNSVSPLSGSWTNEYDAPSTGDFDPVADGNCDGGGVAISGLSTDMAGEDWDDPPTIGVLEITSSGYTITADTGTFTLTGTAAELLKGYVVDAASGTFALTGTEAGLQKGLVVTAELGSYVLTGQDAVLKKTNALAADSGTFNLIGTAASLFLNRLLSADNGAFTVSGNDASLLFNRSIPADSGSIVFTGSDATLIYSSTKTLTADTGIFALTGPDVGLLYGRIINADSGLFILTGTDASLIYSLGLLQEAFPMSYASVEESIILVGDFTTGDSVTIDIYRVSDDSQVVTAGVAQEIASTGYFKYLFSQTIAVETNYIFSMKSSSVIKTGICTLLSSLNVTERSHLLALDTENVDIAKVNGIDVTGVGTAGDPWGPV